MTIDWDNHIPLHVQVRKILCEHIRDLEPGDKLPSESNLCEAFGVSRTVIRRAFLDISHEGLIIRCKGKGTFVADPKTSQNLIQNLTGFYQDMAEHGYEPVSQILTQKVVTAGPAVAKHLKICAKAPVIAIERLRFIQDDPIVLVVAYFPEALCPDLVKEDLTHQSLYTYIEREYDLVVVRGRRTIEAVPAKKHEAQLLQIKNRGPLIQINSVSYLKDGTPLEYYRALHRSDRSKFEVDLVRVSKRNKLKKKNKKQKSGITFS